MKKLLALILSVLCLLALCACGNDVTSNPLITVPETDDPLYVSDRGIFHVEGAFVVKAHFLVDEGGGNYQPRIAPDHHPVGRSAPAGPPGPAGHHSPAV